MNAFVIGLLALAPALTTSAAAGEHPLFAPARDVAVVYRLASDTPTGGVPAPRPDTMTFAYSARIGRMRVDAGVNDYTITDRGAGWTYVVLRAQRSYLVERADSAATPAFLLSENATYTRVGDDMVAGLPCTVWRIARQGWEAMGCVSSDGVILRHVSQISGGGTASIEAISVVYSVRPPALFEPPSGFQRLEMPRPARR